MAGRHNKAIIKVSPDGAGAPPEEESKGRRRGLGAMGLRVWQNSVPELTLLPLRDGFSATEIADLLGLRPAQLRDLGRDFPQLLPSQEGGRPHYSRAQAEGLLRAKRLHLSQGMAIDDVQKLLGAPSAQTPRPVAALPAPAPVLALPEVALSSQGVGAMPAAALESLIAELTAIVDLCNDHE